MAEPGDIYIDVPLRLRSWNTGTIHDYMPYGNITGLCRIPMGWDDAAYRGGVAMTARGYYGQYVNNDAREQVVGGYDSTNLLLHPPVGASADALGDDRWIRQDRLLRVEPYSMYSGASSASAIWAQRHGKYLYHVAFEQRADAFFAPTVHFVKMSGNDSIGYVDSGGYAFNDFYSISSPYSAGYEDTNGYATDHEFPWVWYQHGNTIMRFRDDNRQLGYRYHVISNSGDYYVGRIWLNMQSYGGVSNMVYGFGVLTHPWNVSDYEPPELWWFVKTEVGGHLNGGITIYRAQWKAGQFTRPTGTNNWHGWQVSETDYYAEMMAQENPHAEAFEKSWFNDAHIVGTIEPNSWWAPAGTETGVGTLEENPTTIRVLRHPSIRDSLTLLFVIPSGAVVYHSMDNGKTWGRPTLTRPYFGGSSHGAVRAGSVQSVIVLDDGKPIMPAEYYGNAYSADIGHSGILIAAEGVTKGMGYFDTSSVTHRRSDINRGAWV